MIRIDHVMLAVLPCVVLPMLWLARTRPRTSVLLLAALCVIAPLATSVALQIRGFGALRLLAWGIFAGFPIGALGIALVVRKRDVLVSSVTVASAILLFGVYGYAFHVEPYRLDVNHHRIETAHLDEPLRIVLVADLQTDEVGDYERRAMRAVRDAKPDLVLLSGDYLQCNSKRALERETPLMQQLFADPPLAPRYGVHAVAGNCETGWNWQPLFAGTEVRTYDETQSLDVGPLRVDFLSFAHSRKGRRIEAAGDRYHIALGHCPDFALDDSLRADLLLAGHCHGGQVRIPLFGPPIKLSHIPREWTEGLVELPDGRKLIVSRGIGMERGMAPRLRFLCRPEVVVIDLVPAG